MRRSGNCWIVTLFWGAYLGCLIAAPILYWHTLPRLEQEYNQEAAKNPTRVYGTYLPVTSGGVNITLEATTGQTSVVLVGPFVSNNTNRALTIDSSSTSKNNIIDNNLNLTLMCQGSRMYAYQNVTYKRAVKLPCSTYVKLAGKSWMIYIYPDQPSQPIEGSMPTERILKEMSEVEGAAMATGLIALLLTSFLFVAFVLISLKRCCSHGGNNSEVEIKSSRK